MKFTCLYITLIAMLFIVNGCSRKTTPEGNSSRSVYGSDSNKTATTNITTSKPVTVKNIKTPTPKMIVVNDNVASKTFDGRLYYDLDGHRYWKNYRDGKYYIYNKSMVTDPAFKKPGANP